MILKALAHKIIAYVHKHPHEHGSRYLLECAKHTGQDLTTYVNKLPADMIMQVRDYVPRAFPRKLRDVPLQAKRNSLGAWRIDPVEHKIVGTTTSSIISDDVENFSNHLNR